MTDWTSTMQQMFEYFIVDPNTWRDIKKLNSVISCTINRDNNTETLGSASLETTEQLDECYIRIYLITIQNGVKERHPLGVFMVQTPSISFDGKITKITMDSYTPLLELKESLPPLGYYIPKETNIMKKAFDIIKENARAPVIETEDEEKLSFDFVANTDDTWITFINDLIANANFTLGLDELGQVIFLPNQDVKSLNPIWTFDDSNSSILYPELDISRDLYGIPNVVEVIYSKGSMSYYYKAENNDENSPISTINRGREIIHRENNPEISGYISEERIKDYAINLLRKMSTLEYTLSYTHGYCPVRLGDCVRLNYKKAGLNNVKAKIISQSIKCEPGCPVTEKAVFTDELWEGWK